MGFFGCIFTFNCILQVAQYLPGIIPAASSKEKPFKGFCKERSAVVPLSDIQLMSGLLLYRPRSTGSDSLAQVQTAHSSPRHLHFEPISHHINIYYSGVHLKQKRFLLWGVFYVKERKTWLLPESSAPFGMWCQENQAAIPLHGTTNMREAGPDADTWMLRGVKCKDAQSQT